MSKADITKAQRILATIISYAKQPSTYRGLVYMLGAFGVSFNPQYYAGILAALLLVNGLINFFRNEDKRKTMTPDEIEQAGRAMLASYYKLKRRQKDGSDTAR